MVKTVVKDDIIMDCCCFGKGNRTFVIIPGISVKPVSAAIDAAADLIFGDYTDDYTFYIFDRRSNIGDSYSTEEMAEDTFSVMSELGLENVNLYGVSQGGMIALVIAANHPQIVEKLVIGSSSGDINGHFASVINEWIKYADEGNGDALQHSFIDNVYSPSTIAARGDAIYAGGDSFTADEMKRFTVIANAILSFDAENLYGKITCPAFVLGADGDNTATADGVRKLASKLRCPLYMFGSEFGHAVYDETPEFYRRVFDFIR